MRVSSTDDCRLFQKDLNRLQGWCREKKYDLNAGKCKSISFFRGLKPVIFQYVIGNSDLDNRMTFFNHIESHLSHLSGQGWSMQELNAFNKLYKICIARSTQPLPSYESRCQLLRLEF
jgi:hypothetical protein